MSHRTWGNVTSSQNGLPSASPENVEVLVQVQGISCYLVHAAAADGAGGEGGGAAGGGGGGDNVADGNGGGGSGMDRENIRGHGLSLQDNISEIHLESSTLICLSNIREALVSEVGGAAAGVGLEEAGVAGMGTQRGGFQGVGGKVKSRPLVRDVVCQVASGKWKV